MGLRAHVHLHVSVSMCGRKREKGKAKGQLYSVYTNIKTGVTMYSRAQLLEKYDVVDPEPDLRTLRKGKPKSKAKAKAKGKAKAKAKGKVEGRRRTRDSGSGGDGSYVLDSDENLNDPDTTDGEASDMEGRGQLYYQHLT